MRKLLLLLITLMLSGFTMSQLATPEQYTNWETSNTYIAGTGITALGTIICLATKQPLEITPQAGPSINWINTDTQLTQLLQSYGTEKGSLWGYSVGATITKNKEIMSYKLGLFFESKGWSYSNNSYLIYTDNQGNIIQNIKVNTTGYDRLNYLTIPLTIGVHTNTKISLSVDLGGFISLPISENHRSTTNGITSSDFEPIYKIGPNFGMITNFGVKIPVNDKIDIKFDTRQLSSLNDCMKSQIGKSFNQSVQLLIGLNIKLNNN